MATRTLPQPDFQGYVSNNDPRVQPTGAIRNLQLESGNPGAYADLSNRTAGNVADSTPSGRFGQLLMQLLQKHQQLGTGKFAQQEFNARDAQTQAGTQAVLDPSLQGYSPGVIQGAGENAQAPYDPLIRGAQQGAQTYGEQLRSFGDALTTTRQFFNDLQNQENKKRDDARSLIKDSLSLFGGSAFDKASKDEIEKLEKEAGLPKGYIQGVGQTMKERELELKRQLKLSTNSGVNDINQNLAEQLVNGQLAPSELSKRTTNYNAVLKAADEYSLNTTGKHFNISEANRNYRYANNPNTLNTLNYLGSLVGGVGQTGNLDELLRLSNTIKRTSFPALNNISAWARLQSGDPSIVAYYATVTEVADQVAKILQGGGTGSGTSDAKLAQAASLFQSGFNKSQVNAVVEAVKPLLANRAKSLVGNNPYLSSYADQFGFQQGGGTIKMTGPLGTFNVPPEQVETFKKNGYK